MLEKEQLSLLQNGFSFVEAIELRQTNKFFLLIKVKKDGVESKAIYYPEEGVQFTIDKRIPRPYEIYHHCAYFLLNQILKWNVAIPAYLFNLDEKDKGCLSPFYEDVETKPFYFYKNLVPNITWIQIAVLDYLASLVDRTANDILHFSDGQVKVTDNGLSFVNGVDFVGQISIVRKGMKGVRLPAEVLLDLELINDQTLRQLYPFLYDPANAIEAVLERKNYLLQKKQVI